MINTVFYINYKKCLLRFIKVIIQSITRNISSEVGETYDSLFG